MSDGTVSVVPRRPDMRFSFIRGLSLALLAMLGIVLVDEFAEWLSAARFAIEFPFQMNFGEGLVWQQANMILRGDGYADITQLPFIVFHYPPVYHVVAGLAAKVLGADFLAVARAVSLASTVGIAIAIGMLIHHGVRTTDGRATATACAGISALTVFTFSPVEAWSPFARVDMLAILLGLCGAIFALRAPENPRLAVVAAAFFVLSLYTKQSAIAAPLAALAVLLIVRPRLAVVGLATGLGLGLAAGAALHVMTDGQFFQHVVAYNMNRFDTHYVKINAYIIANHLFYLLITAYFVARTLGRLIRHNRQLVTTGAFTHQIRVSALSRLECFGCFYILLTTVSISGMLKSGSDINYLVEWMISWSIAIGLVLRSAMHARFSPREGPESSGSVFNLIAQLRRAGLPLLAILIFQCLVIPPPSYTNLFRDSDYLPRQKEILARVRQAEKPVISDDMAIVIMAGKDALWEPAIFAELASLGRWDEGSLVRMIMSKDFSIVITEVDEGSPIFDARYTPTVLAAVKQSYPRQVRIGRFILRYPAD